MSGAGMIQRREDEPFEVYRQRQRVDDAHRDGIWAAFRPMSPEHEPYRDVVALEVADVQRSFGGDVAVSTYVRAYLSARRMIELERRDLLDDRFWPALQPPDQETDA